MAEVPGFVQSRTEEVEGRPRGGCSHREGSRGAALSSALCDSNRAQGNGMELCQGGLAEALRKGSSLECSGHAPELLEFK